MAQKEFLFTPDGLNKLKTELEQLRGSKRQEVAEKIRKAKEVGGIENNAEYDNAKDELSFVEGRAQMLENMIKNAVVIHPKASVSRVALGSRVTVRTQDGKEDNYTIVGSAEADPVTGNISNESPVGKALIGKKLGGLVHVKVPGGTLVLKVVGIQ